MRRIRSRRPDPREIASGPSVRRSATRPPLRARADGDDDGPVASTPPTDGNVDARNPRVGASEDADAADAPVNLVDEFKRGVAFGTSMKERFTQARIDDRRPLHRRRARRHDRPGLRRHGRLSPRHPTSLVAASPRRGCPGGARFSTSPALSHGAKLVRCWIPGALAARAYEREAYDGTVDEAVRRTVRGGCFAVGVLILLTQFTIAAQFAAKGQPPPNLGDG